MYLELVCKYGDTYAVRGDNKGYAYYTEEDMKRLIRQIPTVSRNCVVRNDTIALKTGVLPRLGAGVNFVTHFDGRLAATEYVNDVNYWFNAHINMLCLDDWVLSILTHSFFYKFIDVKTKTLRTPENKQIHMNDLPENVKAIIIAHTILESDRVCVLNITNCDKNDAFLSVISRFKAVFLYSEDFKMIKDRFKCNVYLDGTKVR